MQCSLLFIHLNPVLWLQVLHVPVHVHNARRLLKNLLDLLCNINLARFVGTVHFRNQRLHHGRARRYFADLDSCTEWKANLLEFGPESLCDIVTLGSALL